MGYVTIIRADPRGWALAYRNVNTIVHHRLHAPSNDPEAARREARMLVSPDVAVIIPRLGERVPDDTTSEC